MVIGSTWWWNKYGALKEIELQVEKKFNKKIKNIVKRRVSKYDKHVVSIEADMARSMAISARKDRVYSHSVYWWSKYIENSIKVDNPKAIRHGVGLLIEDLESLKATDKGKIMADIHSCQLVVETIKKLPEILNEEKKNILKICKGRDKEDEKDENIVEKVKEKKPKSKK